MSRDKISKAQPLTSVPFKTALDLSFSARTKTAIFSNKIIVFNGTTLIYANVSCITPSPISNRKHDIQISNIHFWLWFIEQEFPSLPLPLKGRRGRGAHMKCARVWQNSFGGDKHNYKMDKVNIFPPFWKYLWKWHQFWIRIFNFWAH